MADQERSAFMFRHIMQVKDLAPGETPEDHMAEVVEKYKAIDRGDHKRAREAQNSPVVNDKTIPLADMSARGLVEYAASLTPPLELVSGGVKKVDNIAAIELHLEAHAREG
jgi:hypothetical protein